MAEQYLSVGELDFDSLKDEFVSYLRTQNQFKDFDFEGSNMAAILDVLTYNTYINAYYLNQVGSESFLDTAQLKESVVSHAKELNYTPRSRNSSRAVVNISLEGNINDGTAIINKFTPFRTTLGSNNLIFSTDRDIVATNDGTGTFVANNITVFEGQVVSEFYDITSANNKLVVSSANVDVDSIDVVVQRSLSDLSNTSFSKAENLFNLTPDSNVFFIQGFGDNKYEIEFGNGVTGKKLTPGNIVRVRYRDTIGAEGNGARTFSSSNSSLSAATVSKSSSGAERESIDSIRFNAPRVFSTQERAITVEDYKALVKKEFPTIETLNVIGGEKLSPPRFGKVVVIPKPFNALFASRSLKNSIVEFLKNKASVSTEVITADPKFVILDINSTVRFNSTQTTRTAEEIKSAVVNSIIKFGTDNLNEFDKDFRYSKLLFDIDNTDGSILSNNTKVRMTKEVTPFASTVANYNLDFNNRIVPGSIQSSLFVITINGVNFECFLEDSNGSIRLATESRGSKEILNFEAGTVEYESGAVQLFNFKVDSFFKRGRKAFGDRVQIYAQNEDSDILVEQDQIVLIQTLNVNVSVSGQTTDD